MASPAASDASLLRVHSKDLHDHVLQEVAEGFESEIYTDMVVRCGGGEEFPVHRLVLAAVSPYLRMVRDHKVNLPMY
jgi:hypothetical protein